MRGRRDVFSKEGGGDETRTGTRKKVIYIAVPQARAQLQRLKQGSRAEGFFLDCHTFYLQAVTYRAHPSIFSKLK